MFRAPGAGSRLYRALKGFTLKGIIYKPRAPPWGNEILPHYTSPVRVHPEGFTLKGEIYWNSCTWRFSTEQDAIKMCAYGALTPTTQHTRRKNYYSEDHIRVAVWLIKASRKAAKSGRQHELCVLGVFACDVEYVSYDSALSYPEFCASCRRGLIFLFILCSLLSCVPAPNHFSLRCIHRS